LIVGAGPAGLAAAHALVQRGARPLVVEQSSQVGGIARTEVHRGYRFDIGGHRFYTREPTVQRLWQEMLGQDFMQVTRLSRIYYRGRFFDYPLRLPDVISKLGVAESGRILASYVRVRVRPLQTEETFEQWAINRFGRRLYQAFFQSYTEKVWGIPCHQIRAEWAAQRIMGLSLASAVADALGGTSGARSLIKTFHYPVLGPGMMWERFCDTIAAHGGQVWLDSPVERLSHHAGRVTHVEIDRAGTRETLEVDHVISSMPVSTLVRRLDPAPPADVQAAARGLTYRAFILVGLIVNRAHLFPDNWLYIHAPDVQVGRIQNFKNWSPAMVPDAQTTSLGLEYFCNEGDALWQRPDAELLSLAAREMAALRLSPEAAVVDGIVIRQPAAYPVYDQTYRQNLVVIQRYLAGFSNLQTIGRNGLHRYNNQDHAMLTGILAAGNVLGEKNDVWEVNTDRSYYEDVVVPPTTPGT
jgi:protoporphyrinogen oxidase